MLRFRPFLVICIFYFYFIFKPQFVEEDWISGRDAAPVQISMRTGANIKTYKPVMYKPSEAAIVVSERNNDRKFLFLSEETNPDYRPRTTQSTTDSGPDKTKVKGSSGYFRL